METRKKKRSAIGGAPPPDSKKARTPIRDRPDRAAIEHELATGGSVRAIARKYNVHEDALYKYRRQLPPQVKAAYIGNLLKPGADLEALKVQESDGLLRSLAQQRARLLIMQDAAMEDSNGQLVANLAGHVHRNLELVGRYLGELAAHTKHTTTTISILVSPEYLALRHSLMRALAPFPDAKRAVAEAIAGVENAAARGTQEPKLIDVSPSAETKQ